METQQRSVAEIIGWEFRALGRTVCYDDQGRPVDSRAAGYYCPPGVDYSDGSPPNVDDMLAWLSAAGWCTTIDYLQTSGPDVHPTPVLISLRHNSRPDLVGMPMFTSVHNALESAVRAVADA